MANWRGYQVSVDTHVMDAKIQQIRELSEECANDALKLIGESAVGFAVENITKQKAVDTGWLRDHIEFVIRDDEVFVGSRVHYAMYVEFGTGDMGTGTGPKWTYYVPDGKYAGFHQTSGMKPRPFLRPAATNKDAQKAYKTILVNELKEAVKRNKLDGKG